MEPINPSVLQGQLEEQSEDSLKLTLWDRILTIFATSLFLIMLAFVLLQVLTRYLTVHIGISFPWTEEVARYLLIITTFLGASVAFRRNEHIRITTIVERFPLKVRVLLEMVGYLLILYFLTLTIQGSNLMMNRMMRSPVGAITWLKVGHLYGATLVGMLIMLSYTIRWIFKKSIQVYHLWLKGGK